MENLAILIPARLSSTRLPNKPLADIAGLPMIVHVANRAIEAGFKNIFVCTDSEEIFNIVQKYNINVIMTSNHHLSGTDRINEALQKIDPQNQFEYLINLQGDLPTIEPELIKKLAKEVIENNYDINTLAAVIKNTDEITNPNIVKIALSLKDKFTGKALYFSRSPIPHGSDVFYHHIGIYGFKRKAFNQFSKLNPSKLELTEKLEQLRALENDISIGVKIVDTIPIGVDTAEDLEKARNFLENRNV